MSGLERRAKSWNHGSLSRRALVLIVSQSIELALQPWADFFDRDLTATRCTR